MVEYRMVRCSECGQERRGPRLIRLSAEHLKRWKEIEKNILSFDNWYALVWIMSMLISFGLTIASVRYSGVSLQIILNFLLWLGVWILLSLILDFTGFLPFDRRVKALKVEQEEINQHYGIPNDESYELVLDEKEGEEVTK